MVEAILREIRGVPGVESAGVTTVTPTELIGGDTFTPVFASVAETDPRRL